MAKIKNFKLGPEAIVQRDLVAKLRSLRWSVRETHGNLYSRGWPDLFCAHKSYGTRWIEVKDPNRQGSLFTNAQLEYFAELASVNCGVWVLMGDSEHEINKLFKPPNWWHYLQR